MIKDFQVVINTYSLKNEDITYYGVIYKNEKYFIKEEYNKQGCSTKIYDAGKHHQNAFTYYIRLCAFNGVEHKPIDDRFIKLIEWHHEIKKFEEV